MGSRESILFGREYIFSHVEKRVDALEKGYRQNLGLIGSEGCGKTQFLNAIYRSLVTRNDFIVIYINGDVLGFDPLIHQWMGAVLFGYLRSLGKWPEYGALEDLNKEASSLIPKTCDKILQIQKLLRKNERGATILKETLSLTGTLSEESSKKVILMIQEFHSLEALKISDPFSMLGREIMVEKETLYLFSSSRPEKAREIFREKLSLLFGNFEILEMAPMTFQDAKNYFEAVQPGFIFSDAQRMFLTAMTDGLPIYLDLILDQLGTCFPVSHEQNGVAPLAVPNERLFHAFLKELVDPKGRLTLLFEKRLQVCRKFAKDSAPYIQAIVAIGAGRRKALSIAAFINKSVQETKKILARLVSEEMIAKRGSFYVIEDSLFRFWLIEAFLRRQHRFEPHDAFVRFSFLNSLERIFDRITQQKREDIVNRLESLFKEFRNDLVELNQKKWQCPQFTEVTLRGAPNGFALLVGKNRNTKWLCQVATDPVREEDVAKIKENFGRFRRKIQRKILVILGGIDQNAKLLAQEAKIQLWDQRNLNLLLEMYHLPRIIAAEELHVPKQGALAEIIHAV